MTDYICAKFGDFSFSRFGFITDGQTDRITDSDDRYEGQSKVLQCDILAIV